MVTSEHTVRQDEEITIGFPGGATVPATLVGRDPGTDIAVLKADNLTVPAASLSEAKLHAGALALVSSYRPLRWIARVYVEAMRNTLSTSGVAPPGVTAPAPPACTSRPSRTTPKASPGAVPAATYASAMRSMNADALAAELTRTTPERAARLLVAFADRNDSVPPAVLEVAKNGPKQVRIAAIGVVGRLGDESSLSTLLEIAGELVDL